MNKKRLVTLASGVLIALLLTGLIGAAVVSAQEPTPETEAPFGWRGGGRGQGGFGRGTFGGAGGGQWTMFDTAAEALELTPEELFAELHAGKSLEEVVEEQGVEMEAVQDAMNAARSEAMRQVIKQAVQDGNMTQEQADWMIEGLEKGFVPGGRGFSHGRGRGRCPCPDTDTADV